MDFQGRCVKQPVSFVLSDCDIVNLLLFESRRNWHNSHQWRAGCDFIGLDNKGRPNFLVFTSDARIKIDEINVPVENVPYRRER